MVSAVAALIDKRDGQIHHLPEALVDHRRWTHERAIEAQKVLHRRRPVGHGAEEVAAPVLRFGFCELWVVGWFNGWDGVCHALIMGSLQAMERWQEYELIHKSQPEQRWRKQ